MNYDELNKLYKNNDFRNIDMQENSKKFYLLRSISKSKTIKKFCNEKNINIDFNEILENKSITEDIIINFIKKEFTPKGLDEIHEIESELNKMQNFDWGRFNGE